MEETPLQKKHRLNAERIKKIAIIREEKINEMRNFLTEEFEKKNVNISFKNNEKDILCFKVEHPRIPIVHSIYFSNDFGVDDLEHLNMINVLSSTKENISYTKIDNKDSTTTILHNVSIEEIYKCLNAILNLNYV
jgi:hypothetical protein